MTKIKDHPFMQESLARDQEKAEQAAWVAIDNMKLAGMPEYHIYEATMQLTGGDCRLCGKPWKRTEPTGFSLITFFLPTCNCDSENMKKQMLQLEMVEVKERWHAARIPDAEFDLDWSDWNYQVFPNQNHLSKAQINEAMRDVQEYSNSEKFKSGKGLVLHGTPGTGKTMCAILALKTIIRNNPGIKGHFVRMAELGERVIHSSEENGYISSLLENNVVVVDDMDKVNQAKDWIRYKVFDFYDALIQKKVAIIGTTELENSDAFKPYFPANIISRIFGYVQSVKFGGKGESDDYRLLRNAYLD